MEPIRMERLLLRQWRPADRAPFAALNADPEVMRHVRAPLSQDESDDLLDRCAAEIHRGAGDCGRSRRARRAGCWASPGSRRSGFEAHFTPALEVGWRLRRDAWGQGYATEAARAALAWAFATGGPAGSEVVSFTAATNERSWAVMRRLKMSHDPRDDFDHPSLLASSPLSRHVLYRLTREAYLDARTAAEDRGT